MGILKNKYFWYGVIVGTVVGPMVVDKVKGGKAKLPAAQ